MTRIETLLQPVRHGLIMGVLALLFGALWAAYMATHHEQLHGAFEAQQEKAQQINMQHMMEEMNMDGMHAADQHSGHSHGSAKADHHAGGNDVHSHSGSLAMDAMQRLLRGHIHFMGIGLLTIVLLLLVLTTGLKACWKYVFGWTFGLGALLYPPAWILMGFRTVELGPQAAEASVLWLFGPAVGLLIGSLIALLVVMLLEWSGLKRMRFFAWAFS